MNAIYFMPPELPPEFSLEVASLSDELSADESLSLISELTDSADETSSVDSVDEVDSTLLLEFGLGLLLVALLEVALDASLLKISDEVSVSEISFSDDSISSVAFDVSVSEELLSISPSGTATKILSPIIVTSNKHNMILNPFFTKITPKNLFTFILTYFATKYKKQTVNFFGTFCNKLE